MDKPILIVDDDIRLNELLQQYLSDFGFEVMSAAHPDDGLKLLEREDPALVVLDIMLPDLNGFEVCKKIRSKSTVPIIMLTARGEVTDRILGLELGADDYLAKPFEPRELVARIHSVLRRVRGDDTSRPHTFGPLTIDFIGRRAHRDGNDLQLTTNEFEALSLLVKNAGKVLDRDQILQALRGIDCEAYNRSVDITMSRLRQKLGDHPKNPRFIKTVWGTGYMFIAKG
jgi:DNA-binding response OmpR family regulator